MIRKWEMALWAIIAGTTVIACGTASPMYFSPARLDVEDFTNPESAEPDVESADIPEDLLSEEDEDTDDDVEDEG